MPARDENSELIQRMYMYSSAVARLVESGKLTRGALGRSLTTQWMITTPLQQIGECAWKLDKSGENLGEEIPLRKIAALRHRLVHHYEGIDWNVAEEVVFEDAPKLANDLRVVMKARGIAITEFETEM